MLDPFPHQIVGADFLAARTSALLADAPRVGKTGTAIMAADKVGAKRILVVTTASGRPVWARAFRDWSTQGRTLEVHYTKDIALKHELADVLIVGWAAVSKLLDCNLTWDLIVLDESHYAKNLATKRTKAVYGEIKAFKRHAALVDTATRVWCLTGTPIPNAPNDLFPMLRALAPERLEGVERYDQFLREYCVVRKKRINPWTQIDIVVGGRNLDALRARMDGFWLRRTQEDVGITRPIYEVLPVHINARQRAEIEAAVPDADEVLAAAETGETKGLEMHLGTLRRVTGAAKAAGVAQAVADEIDGGLDKVVLMCWHREVMDTLSEALSGYGVVRVDGSTSPKHRYEAVEKFSKGGFRVFIGQMVACGEAIDLSAAADLIFVESSFVPKDMAQAALRITNHTQERQPRVRVAALEGSIDEAVQAVLLRKVATNKEVMK